MTDGESTCSDIGDAGISASGLGVESLAVRGCQYIQEMKRQQIRVMIYVIFIQTCDGAQHHRFVIQYSIRLPCLSSVYSSLIT